MAGAVVLVATPIGNLGDFPPRAVEALQRADVIACEDTRHSRKLLSHFGIAGSRLVALHEHNEVAQSAVLVERVQAGERVAVITDAGTPGISDPGEVLVAAAVAAGVTVELVPGPSAPIAALVLSGLPTRRFAFEGFLPRKGRERAARLAVVARDDRTTILFESPHRVVDTVDDLAEACGPDRRVAIARELTKLYEEVWRGTLADGVTHVATATMRGEFVIVVEGAPAAVDAEDADVDAAIRARLEAGDDKRTAIASVMAELNVSKKRAYDASLRVASAKAGGTTPPRVP